MSATPRETLKQIRCPVSHDGYLWETLCTKCEDEGRDILHAAWCPVPAFDALLAVAKAAAIANTLSTEVEAVDWSALPKALQALENQHPGWREWTP